MKSVPKHVGIIMDGNGRWAEQRGKQRWQGHIAGAENIDNILYHAISLGVETLTVYALSLDNIEKRFDEEKQHLFRLFYSKLGYAKKKLNKEHIRLRFLGDLTKLPIHIQERADDVTLATSENNKGTLAIAMAYGGQNEIKRAVEKAYANSSDDFTKYLDSIDFPPLDLIIRTGVQDPTITRLSDFMLWQSAYAEIYSTPVYWPDFDCEEFNIAIHKFKESERKFGAVLAQRKDWGGF
ncbi:polyprenyl diphosphate synthase [Saccharicrinis aurantiacus]|uniref:polyprenyl diphosphate synthase n=1 Tax=Saccharicrinis aurantiacus TaxID=1849719 RepID=UPI00095017EF|nr:polyprenyl diphosphate synthase [Saccharicrinis aurantiacus]